MYEGDTPTKNPDAQYTYTFKDWDQDITKPVTQNITFKAVYDRKVNSYTIKWVNDDEEYAGETPSKEADAKNTYAFAGWDPAIAKVTGDATYKAKYNVAKNKYTITWKDENGTELRKDQVEYGVVPDYGVTPIKESDAQYTYSFKEWSPKPIAVTGNTDYTAVYDKTVNTYVINWVNDDNTVLKTESLEYGATPEYKGDTPAKAADAENTYTFAGWDPAITNVTGAITYKAKYAATKNKYTITWKDENGTELRKDQIEYGTVADYGSVPSKTSDAQYTYSFKEWSPKPTKVTGNTEYTAVYDKTINTYTVIWQDADGTLLEKDENVAYGSMPAYNSPAPAKQSDAQYTYAFKGWDQNITVPVTQNVTFTAVYDQTINTYTVTWVNEDGTILETDNNVAYGTTPEYNGNTPVKTGDAQSTYDFTGWSPEVKNVTGNVTYKAVYSATKNKYTITWKDENGTVLKSEELEYGATPNYGDAPEKAADEGHVYTFAGWDPAVTIVTDNAEYTATYTSEIKTYTVIWQNADGSELEKDVDVPYGTTPEFNGSNPSKEGNAQYSYAFNGWNPVIAPVTRDVTYTAAFTETVNAYPITWKNADGSQIKVDNFNYGAMPVYSGDDPVKAEDEQSTYHFSGWSPEISTVTGPAEYTAVFSANIKQYDVTWLNADGANLQTSKVNYGTVPSYEGETPSMDDAQYIYTFTGWDKEPTGVNGDQTYKAVYEKTLKKYTITWKDENGVTLKTVQADYGSTPDYGDTIPNKQDAQYDYKFSGWQPQISPVTGNAEYNVSYEKTVRKYTVTWKDEDGTELRQDQIEYGTVPEYGSVPSKTSDAQFTYAFDQWNPEIKEVTQDAEYTAAYVKTLKQYTITWRNYDGSVLKTDQADYGSTPVFGVDNPVKPDDEGIHYNFSGWDPKITSVTGDTIYTAQFSSETAKGILVWRSLDGTVIKQEEIEYGTEITIPDAPKIDGYQFLYWEGSKYYPGDKYIVRDNHTFTAKYQKISTTPQKEPDDSRKHNDSGSIASQDAPANSVTVNIPAIDSTQQNKPYRIMNIANTSDHTDLLKYTSNLIISLVVAAFAIFELRK